MENENSPLSVFVLIPCFGAKEPINATLNNIPSRNLSELGFTLNVLIVATPDSDDNVPNLDNLKEVFPNVEMVIERRRGYGRAYKTGFNFLKSKSPDIIVTADADGTYPLKNLENFLSITNGSESYFFNVGRLKKYHEGAFSRRNLLGNYLLTWGTKILFFKNINDSQSGMWILDKKALEEIKFDLLGDGMEFSAQIKIYSRLRKGISYQHIEGEYFPRAGNEPQLRWLKDAIRVAWKTFTFRFKNIN